MLTLVHEAFRQAAADARDVVGVIRIITEILSGGGYMKDVVNVVIPLGSIERRLAIAVTLEKAAAIVLVFDDEMNLAVGYRFTDAARHLSWMIEETERRLHGRWMRRHAWTVNRAPWVDFGDARVMQEARKTSGEQR